MGREFDDYEERKTVSDDIGEEALEKLASAEQKLVDLSEKEDNEAYRRIKTEEMQHSAQQNRIEGGFEKPEYGAPNAVTVIEPTAEMPDDIRILNKAEKQDFSGVAQTFEQAVESNYKEADAWTGREYVGKAATVASAMTYGLQAVNAKGEADTYLSSMTDEQLTGFATTMGLKNEKGEIDISKLAATQNKEFVDDVHQTILQKIKHEEPNGEKGVSGTTFRLSQGKRIDAHLGQIEDYFVGQGINIKTLSQKEINALLKGEEVNGVKLKNKGETELLDSYKKGKNIQKDMDMSNAAKGRGIGIGKEIASKSYEGSDFETGLGITKSLDSLAKASVTGTVTAGETIVSGLTTAVSQHKFKKAEKLENELIKKGLPYADNENIEKLRKKAVKVRNAKDKTIKAGSRVKNFTNKSAFGKAKVIAKGTYHFTKVQVVRAGHKFMQTDAGTKLQGTRIVKSFKALKDSKSAHAVGTVVKTPVNVVHWVNNTKFAKGLKNVITHLNSFGLFMKKIIIGFGLALVGILLISALLLTVMTSVFMIAPTSFADKKDESTPMGQLVMDELWGTQKAYQDLMIDGEITSAGADADAVLPVMPLKKIEVIDQSTGRDDTDILVDDAGNLIWGTPTSKLKFNSLYEGTVEWEEGGVSYSMITDDGLNKTYMGSDGSTVIVPSGSSGPSDVSPTKHTEKVQTTGPIGTHGLDADGNVVTAGDAMPSDVKVDVPTINVEYKYVDKNGCTTYTTTEGVTRIYTQNDFYKAIFSMATIALGNEMEDHDFYYSYVKQLFDQAYSDGWYEIKVTAVEMPDSAGTSEGVQWISEEYGKTAFDDGLKLTIDVTIYIDASITDMMASDTTTNDWMHSNCNEESVYNTDDYIWEGWGTESERTDSYEMAITTYETDWSAFGINFVGRTASLLSSAEIDSIYEDIVANNGELSGSREDFIRAAMSGVGAFSYGWGSKVTNPDSPPSSLDCSGYVNYMMYLGGVTDNIPGLSCSGLLGSGYDVSTKSGTSWSTSDLKPGDLLIKNDVSGNENGQYNHVVIYLGDFTYNGVTGPHFAECCGGKGSIISSSPRTLNYQYKVNLFDD